MPELMIPPLEPRLAEILEDVVFSKQYKELPQAKWSSDILPKLIIRLEEIASISNKDGERYSSKRPRGVDLPQSINRTKDKIVKHLKDVFLDKPPFTIQRIAEIILHPEREGYILSNNTQVLKYFNSFSKLVVVASSIFDYPEVTFVNPTLGGSKTTNPPTNQTVQTIPLVPIPWLKTESPGKEKLSDGNSLVLDPMLISSPPADELQNVKGQKSPEDGTIYKHGNTPSASPSRRRREKDASEMQSESTHEYAAKRARIDDKPSPCKQRGIELDPDEDRMDISNSTLEDITPNNSNVTPTKSQNNNSDPISDDHNDTADSETILTKKDRDIDNENKMDISCENMIVSDEEPLVY